MSGVGDYQCNDGNGCYSDFDKCNYYNTCDDKSDDLNCGRYGLGKNQLRKYTTFYSKQKIIKREYQHSLLISALLSKCPK